MDTIKLKINEIKPYEKNARKNDQAVDAVAASIKECTYIAPIIVDEDNVILAGHTRHKALKKLGYTEVDVVVVRGLTEEQKRKYRLLDNKTNELAEWDYDLLEEELKDLQFDFEFDWGLDNEVKDEDIVEDDYDEPLPVEPKSKLGEIYKLGDHILMCGDSTSETDVAKLMNGAQADLLFTDPPYNVNVSNSQGMTIQNDNMADYQFKEFLSGTFKCANIALKPGGAFYVWHGDCETVNFRTKCEENNLHVKQCLIWVKNGFTFGRQDYKWMHEPCLYGWKEGAAHYFVDEFNHPTVIEDKIDVNKMTKQEMKDYIKNILADKEATTVIHEDKPTKNDLHPTMKPLKMCAKLIKCSSQVGESVLDLFGGSGSTLIACEQIKRKCYMMEYDPKYVDAIIDRYEKFTGKKAVKL